MLAQLNPPLGKFGVLGNHEFYLGFEQALENYKLSGIPVLRQSLVRLDNGISIAGVDDIKTISLSKKEFEKVFAKADKTGP
ncbi:MAG: hypothetical protein NTW04_00340, partial [Elusimicrobia bacterium]|nr:hypothetical protein [Elusimicrobiota bacterium]